MVLRSRAVRVVRRAAGPAVAAAAVVDQAQRRRLGDRRHVGRGVRQAVELRIPPGAGTAAPAACPATAGGPGRPTAGCSPLGRRCRRRAASSVLFISGQLAREPGSGTPGVERWAGIGSEIVRRRRSWPAAGCGCWPAAGSPCADVRRGRCSWPRLSASGGTAGRCRPAAARTSAGARDDRCHARRGRRHRDRPAAGPVRRPGSEVRVGARHRRQLRAAVGSERGCAELRAGPAGQPELRLGRPPGSGCGLRQARRGGRRDRRRRDGAGRQRRRHDRLGCDRRAGHRARHRRGRGSPRPARAGCGGPAGCRCPRDACACRCPRDAACGCRCRRAGHPGAGVGRARHAGAGVAGRASGCPCPAAGACGCRCRRAGHRVAVRPGGAGSAARREPAWRRPSAPFSDCGLTRATRVPTMASQAESQDRTAPIACRTVSAAADDRDLLMPPRRGDSLIATTSAVTAATTWSSVPAPARVSSAATSSATWSLSLTAAGQAAGLRQRVQHGERQRVGRIRVGPQGSRIQLAQHLAQRGGGGVPAVEHRDVGSEHRLVADQLSRRRDRCGVEGAGLQRAGQAHGAPGRRWGGDLLGGVVVGEPLGEVVGGVVVGDGEGTAGCGQQRRDHVVVTVGGDRGVRESTRPFHEQRSQLGIARRVVADLVDTEQPSRVVHHGDGQLRSGRGRPHRLISRRQTAVHAHERHGVVLLPGTAVFGQGLMVPVEGSVAPVHSGRDLADNRAPTQTCLLRPDFTQLAASEETAHSATLGRPERLVQVVERRSRRQCQDRRA